MNLEIICREFGVPFEYVPIAKDQKSSSEEIILKLLSEYKIELVILAKYMQILSLNGYKIKVCLCEDGYWKHDTVFIYNNSKCIAEKEIQLVLQKVSF